MVKEPKRKYPTMSSARLISPPLQGQPASGDALAEIPRSKLHNQLVVLSEKCYFSIPPLKFQYFFFVLRF